MKEIAELAIDVAVSGGATYADCRVVQRGIQAMTVKDGRFAEVSSFEDEGMGVRVIVDGAWGFASVDRLDSQSLGDAARLACRIARASSRLRRQAVRLAPAPVATGEYQTPMERDPFEVSLEEKMDLLIRADEAMAAVAGVTTHEASLEFVREHRLFASSEGSLVDQVIVESGGGMDATATSDDDVQTRSFPNSFGRHQLCAGYEAIAAMDLAGHASRIAAEATTPGGLGTYGWDDEGVAAQRTVLVDRGVFRGYMSSRETAADYGWTSSGAMRAESWNRIPLIRMTNVNLEPGESSLEEMIAGTEHGVYLETNRP